jgi:hypothetical protein
LSTDNSTNWVPLAANLLVFSSQADFQLTAELSDPPTSYFMSLHSTELLTAEQLPEEGQVRPEHVAINVILMLL